MENYNEAFFKERLESISQLSQHLSSTIDDFRGFFKEHKEMQEATLSEIVEGSIHIIGPTLQTREIELKRHFDGEVSVFTYTNEVKQVILNILKNAEDALLEKEVKDAWILVSAFKNDCTACLCVEDNAGGIPQKAMEKVFDPYFSTKEAKDGTGLGLYMSKTIIEEHCKGRLGVCNTEHGAKFVIELPLQKGEC